VRAVCNYGLFDQREVPQYYPDVNRRTPQPFPELAHCDCRSESLEAFGGGGGSITHDSSHMPSTSRASKLSHHLGYWLRLVSNPVSVTFARKLTAEEVTVAEWVVLYSLTLTILR
jgi:hypothetical protein